MQCNKLLSIVVLVLVFVVGLQYFQYRQQQQQFVQLQQQLLTQQQALQQTNERLEQAQQKLKMLDENSVEGIVKQANDAILDGWQLLLDSVSEELENVKKSVRSQTFGSDQPQAQQPPDSDTQTPADAAQSSAGSEHSEPEPSHSSTDILNERGGASGPQSAKELL